MTCARCHRSSLSEGVLCSWGRRSKPRAWHTGGARCVAAPGYSLPCPPNAVSTAQLSFAMWGLPARVTETSPWALLGLDSGAWAQVAPCPFWAKQ